MKIDPMQEILEIVDGIVTDDHETDRKFRARVDRIVARLKKVLNSVSRDTPKSSIEQYKARLLTKGLSYEDLLSEAALYASLAELVQYENDTQKRLFAAERMMNSLLLAIIRRQSEKHKITSVVTDIVSEAKSTARFLEGALKGREAQKTLQGKKAIEARHSQPGGSRDKQQKIREAWASGKYRSRDECAEKEHDALSMSYGTARKALRNTPNHT